MEVSFFFSFFLVCFSFIVKFNHAKSLITRSLKAAAWLGKYQELHEMMILVHLKGYKRRLLRQDLGKFDPCQQAD